MAASPNATPNRTTQGPGATTSGPEIDWKWFAAWLALWLVLVAIEETNPELAPAVAAFAVGIAGVAVAELIYNGSLLDGLRTIGVPV